MGTVPTTETQQQSKTLTRQRRLKSKKNAEGPIRMLTLGGKKGEICLRGVGKATRHGWTEGLMEGGRKMNWLIAEGEGEERRGD